LRPAASGPVQHGNLINVAAASARNVGALNRTPAARTSYASSGKIESLSAGCNTAE